MEDLYKTEFPLLISWLFLNQNTAGVALGDVMIGTGQSISMSIPRFGLNVGAVCVYNYDSKN